MLSSKVKRWNERESEQYYSHSLVFDARGNGGGEVSPTITGDHQNRVTDYTALVVRYEETIQSSEA